MATQGKGAYTLTVLSQQGLLSDLPFLGYHNPVENNMYHHSSTPQQNSTVSVSVVGHTAGRGGLIIRS